MKWCVKMTCCFSETLGKCYVLTVNLTESGTTWELNIQLVMKVTTQKAEKERTRGTMQKRIIMRFTAGHGLLLTDVKLSPSTPLNYKEAWAIWSPRILYEKGQQ